MESITIEFIRVLLIFAFGSLLGWVIEFFYRGAKLNPGFLSGPYLPIYGIGTVILNYISGLEASLLLKLLLFAVSTTLLELMTGLVFVNHFRLKLWDYSKNSMNFLGIICPLYTFYWTILSLVFYLSIYPFITRIVMAFYANLELSFLVGIFYGVFLVDLSQSFKLASRVKAFFISRKELAAVSMESLRSRLDSQLKAQGHRSLLVRFFSSPNRLLNNDLFAQLNVFMGGRKEKRR